MTKLLEKAFAAVSQLPENEQDNLAQRLPEDLHAESKWSAAFSSSEDALKNFAGEAIEEFKAGRTLPQLDDDVDRAHD